MSDCLPTNEAIIRETLLAYPDHNKTFYVETDASDYQLGGRIFQKDVDESGKEVERDIAFYTRKLNGAQKNYSMIKKELLSIVENVQGLPLYVAWS